MSRIAWGVFDTNEKKLIETERLPFGGISNVEDLASQLEVPAERVIILPPAENVPQSNFSNVLTGKAFEPGSESLNQLRQLQFNLQQQNSPNHQALNQRGLREPMKKKQKKKMDKKKKKKKKKKS